MSGGKELCMLTVTNTGAATRSAVIAVAIHALPYEIQGTTMRPNLLIRCDKRDQVLHRFAKGADEAPPVRWLKSQPSE